MTLPTDRDARNALPVWDGCIDYFKDCWAEIAKVSVLGNKQHGLGEKLHFARDISTDHFNKVIRHMLDHAAGHTFDDGGKTRHLAKAAWRILASLQVSIEEDNLRMVPEAPERGPQHYGTVDAPKGPPLILNNKAEEPQRLQPGSIQPEGEVLYATDVEETYHGGIRAHQEGSNAPRLRKVTIGADYPIGYTQGSEERAARSQESQLRSNGKETF